MFTESYYPTVDGVVTSLRTVSKELERIGHEVYIFAPEPTQGEKTEDMTRGGTYFFHSFGFKHYPQYRSSILPSNGNRILRRLGVDIVHTHGIIFMGMKGLSAARRFDVPLMSTYHTMFHEAADYYNPLPLAGHLIVSLLIRYMRFYLNRVDAVVVPTKPILEELVKIAPRMRHAAVIPTGLDTQRFQPVKDNRSVREEYRIGDAPLLLYLGRVAYEKNIDAIIKALPLVSDKSAKLLIAGDGPARQDLERMVRDMHLQDRVIFSGFVPEERLIDFYSAADVFVSASPFETQGLSILEAMACGRPVASLNYRAVKDYIIDGYNGFLFAAHERSIAATIDRALHCEPHIVRNARKTAEGYSKEKMASQLSELYCKMIDLRARG
ncbi:MAG: glycosyltransferase [Methanomassiliicoccales archaeon]